MKYCARSSLHIYNSSRNFCSGCPYPDLKNGETEAQRKEVLAWVTCNSGAWDFRPVSQASGALCCHLAVGAQGTGARPEDQGRERGHHTVAAVGGAVAEMWREGPKQLPLAQGPELQHWPSQKQAPALCPRAREKAGGPEDQEEASRLISTLCSPTVSLGAQVTFPPDPRVQALPCREVWGMEAAGIGLELAGAGPGLQGRSRAGGLPR